VSLNRIIKALMLTIATSTAVLGNEGLHVGIDIGQSFTQGDMVRKSGDHLRHSSNAGNKNGNVGAFIGYNHLIQDTPLFVGLEFGVQNHNLKINKEEHMVRYSTIAKTNNSFTGVGKIGIIIKDLMVFTKFGLVKTNWDLQFKTNAGMGPPTTNRVKTNEYGTIYGFGVDYKLNTNWGIGVEYTVKTYSSLKLKSSVGIVTFKPTINTTSFRLMYSF